MAKAPVRRLTALLTASSRGIAGFLLGRERTASEVLDSGESEFCGGKVRAVEVVRAASGSFDCALRAPLRMTTLLEEAARSSSFSREDSSSCWAARSSSFSMRWAMISVSVSETKWWPLAMSSALRAS